MRYAIPTANGELCQHFGHCEKFAFVDVENDKVVSTQDHTPPAHEPGVLPRWLSEQKVNIVIAGGMGQRAVQLFTESGIKVVIGAKPGTPEAIVAKHIGGTLETGENICDH